MEAKAPEDFEQLSALPENDKQALFGTPMRRCGTRQPLIFTRKPDRSGCRERDRGSRTRTLRPQWSTAATSSPRNAARRTKSTVPTARASPSPAASIRITTRSGRSSTARERNTRTSILLHGGTPTGAEYIASLWAENRGVTQVVFRPDWKSHNKAAPFKRNDQLLKAMPKGVIACPGSGIHENLVDKARKLGIPVKRIGG